MKKFHSILLACFIGTMNFSCADSNHGEAPLTLASAGSSPGKTSSEAGSSGSTSSNGGFAGSMAGSSSSGEAGSSSGSSGSSGSSSGNAGSFGTAGASGSPTNIGGNAGNPPQSSGGAGGNEVGGSSSGEDYSVYCSKETPVQAKVGSNKGFGYSFNNPMTQENYCNPVCGVGAEKSIMYSFTGKDPPSPDYGECIVVDVGANGFKACCDVIACRATISGCTTDENKTGDLYSCPGGDHVPPKQNCKVKISNATYNNLGDKEVDIGYSQFCCSK